MSEAEKFECFKISENPNPSDFDKDYLYWVFDDLIVKTFKIRNSSELVWVSGCGLDNAVQGNSWAQDDDFEALSKLKGSFKPVTAQEAFEAWVDSIDYGGHDKYKDFAKRDIAIAFASNIDTYIMMEILQDIKDSSKGIKIPERTIVESLNRFSKRGMFVCPECGAHVILDINPETRAVYPYEKWVKKECYHKDINSKISTKITGESGQVIVMNDMRGMFADKEVNTDCFAESINYASGIERAIVEFSKIGIFTTFVGNNNLGVYTDGDKLIFSNRGYGDEGIESVGTENLVEHGSICCDLWWIMATAIENVDMDAINEEGLDYCIIQLEPNMTGNFYFNRFDQDHIEIELG